MCHFIFRWIIIDPSNSPWKSKEWMEEAKKLGICCFSVSEEGVFEDQ